MRRRELINLSKGDLFDLAATISVNDAGVEAKLTSAQRQVLALAAEFKALDAKSAPALKSVGQAAQVLSSHLGNTSNEGHKLAEAFRVLSSSAVVVDGPLGGVAGRLRAMGTEAGALGELLGPAGILVGGLAAIAAASVAAGIGLFELVKSTAEFGDSIFKVHEKTSLSVETISALKVAGHAVGIELETMSTGLIRFVNNLAAAEGGSKKMTAVMSQMGVTAFRDPDKALAQFITRFAELKTDQDRMLAASNAFGLRFGANLVEVFNQVGGNMDEFKAKLRSMGVLMTDEGANASHQFTVDLNELGLEIAGVGRVIGTDLMPVARSAIKELSRLIEENRGEVIEWVHWFENAAAGVSALASVLWQVERTILFLDGMRIPPILSFLAEVATLGIPSNLAALGAAMSSTPFQTGGDASFGAGVVPTRTFKMPGGGGGGGGRGGGGGDPAVNAKRLADLRLKAVVDELKFEEEQNKRSLDRQWIDFDQYAGRYNATEKRRHELVVAGLKEEMDAAEKIGKPQQRTIAIQEVKNKQAQEENTHTKNGNQILDQRAKLLDQVNDFIAAQVREINDASRGTDQYDKAIRDLEVAMRKAGVTEVDFKIAIARTNAETLRAIDLAKQLTRERYAIAQRPRFADPANLAQSVGIELDTTDATRRRRALALSDEVTARLHQLAGDITSTLDTAIRTGFERGAKEGFRALGIGFLQMIEQMAEQWLASEIFKMLVKVFTGDDANANQLEAATIMTTAAIIQGSAAATMLAAANLMASSSGSDSGGGGGGINTFLPFIGTLFGGHGHAAGLGYVPYDNYPAMLHRGEAVIPASQNRNGGGQGNSFTVIIQVPDIQSAGSRDTQRQVANQYRSVMQQAALTG